MVNMSNTSSADILNKLCNNNNVSWADFINKLCNDNTVSWVELYSKGRKTVDHVEGYVIVAAVFLLILLVLGPWRRRSNNVVIQYGVTGAFLMSFPLLSYALGLMHGVINKLNPMWATFLVLLLGGVNSVSVQKLDENKQWRKHLFENTLYMVYLGTNFGGFVYFGGRMMLIPVAIISFLVGYRNTSRISALALAVDPRRSGSSMVAFYMKNFEQELTAEGYNPHTMQGYNYLIHPFKDTSLELPPRPSQQGDIQEAWDKVITLERIWCHGGVLSLIGDPVIDHLKDVCLSFALFRLAVRRYFGYACAESGLQKTRDLVLQGLLPSGEDSCDCKRAFHVVEVELAFLYDFFFTRYAMTMYRGEKLSFLVSLGITILLLYTGIQCLSYLDVSARLSDLEYVFVETKRHDVILAEVILCALAVFQVLESCLYSSSDWTKVSLVCKYIKKSSLNKGNTFYCICIEKVYCIGIEKVLMFLGKISLFLDQFTWFHCWEKKIGQYSLIDHFNYPDHWFLKGLSEIFPMLLREGRKAGTSIPVPMEVKRAIALDLKDSNGMISNGARSLERYGMTQLYWACETDDEITLAHVIMIWHIATSYCEISKANRVEPIAQGSRLVATSLSKYCGYLVAFVPELLPGNPMETDSMLDELVHEARVHIGNGTNKYEKLRGLKNDNVMLREQQIKEGVLTKGAILGMTLESMEDQVTRWKLLADFWAELILYIAPSNNVSGHIEHLAKGGEFVTHVWALLMHAGILERPVMTRAN